MRFEGRQVPTSSSSPSGVEQADTGATCCGKQLCVKEADVKEQFILDTGLNSGVLGWCGPSTTSLGGSDVILGDIFNVKKTITIEYEGEFGAELKRRARTRVLN